MAMQKTSVSIKEFEHFVNLPENAERRFELIDGEIVEMAPGCTWNSGVSYILSYKVFSFCEANNLPCYISGGGGDYDIQGHIVCPDFAYKTTPLSKDYPDTVPPLWAVEVISPTDKAPDIRRKRQIYQEAGILLWELYDNVQRVDVYAPDQPVRTSGIDDTLDGGDVLPGFSLAVKELFAD